MAAWLLDAGRGLPTLVSRLFAVMLSVSGLILMSLALPGVAGTAGATPSVPYSATGSPSDVPAGATPQPSTGLGYTGGAKENTTCPDAPQVPVHSNPPKDQITNAWAASSGQYLYLAWQRASAAGDTAIEFELDQSTAALCNGVQPPRTVGDVLITWQFSGNAGSQGIVAYVWSGTAWGPQITLGTALVSDGISSNGTFADAVLNVDALFSQLGLSSSCVSYHSAFAKSRAGNGHAGTGFGSELKAVLPSIPISANDCPAVSVAKSGPKTALAGSEGTYDLVATNSGPGAASAAVVTDTLPAGETFVSSSPVTCTVVTGATPVPGATPTGGHTISCPVGDLAGDGGTTTVAVVVSYGSGTGPLTDCATVTGQDTSSCVTTTVIAPALAVVKTGPATGDASGSGAYTLTVTNSGEGDASNVVVTDTLPTGETFATPLPDGCTTGVTAVSGTSPGSGDTIACTLATVAAGASLPIDVTVDYGPATAGQSLVDCATSPDQAVASCVTTDIAAATVTTSPLVSVGKSGPSAGTAGGTGTYTLVATNTGNGAASAQTVTETLPTGETFQSSNPAGCAVVTGATPVAGASPSGGQTISCPVGDLAADGGSATVQVTVLYGSGTATQSLTDCATVAGQATPSCVTTTIGAAPVVAAPSPITLTVAKTNNAGGTGYAQTGTATGAGENVPFQVVVTNTSTVPVTISALTDAWPGQAAFSPDCATALVGTTLAAGAQATCDFTVTGYASAPGSSRTDTVDVTACDASNSSDCATVPATSTVFTPAFTGRAGQGTAPTAAAASNPPAATTVPAVATTTVPSVASATVTPATPAAAGALAFTGAPSRLQMLLEMGVGLLSLGLALLWFSRPRRAAARR